MSEIFLELPLKMLDIAGLHPRKNLFFDKIKLIFSLVVVLVLFVLLFVGFFKASDIKTIIKLIETFMILMQVRLIKIIKIFMLLVSILSKL